jgi:hypothetical protein
MMYALSHVIIGTALLGGRTQRTAWTAAAASLLPDLPLVAVKLGALVKGVAPGFVLLYLYWQNWWQILMAVGHDFWLWGACLLLGIAFRHSLVTVFAASALLHSAIDFLCQREDGHMQFWPVSRWIFMSPVSYWDPAHFGNIFRGGEALVVLGLVALLFVRFRSILVRLLLLAAGASTAFSLFQFAAG